MAGRNGADGSRSRFLDSIENRLVTIVIAAVLGGGVIGTGGGTIVNALSPEVRNDPCTGTQCRLMEKRLIELEKHQALNSQHLKDSASGYGRIRNCENRVERIEARQNGVIQEVKYWREQIRNWNRHNHGGMSGMSGLISKGYQPPGEE